MLCTSEPSDRASDGSDLILAINDRESFIAKMRFEPADARSNGLEMCSTGAERTTGQLHPSIRKANGWLMM